MMYEGEEKMEFKDIKIDKVEKAPKIKDLKDGFYRMIFHYSEKPNNEWIPLFSEEYNNVKSIDRVIETFDSFIIIQCKPDEMQTLLNDFNKAASITNEKYKQNLIAKEKKIQEEKKECDEENKKIEEAISKLKFD